MAELRQSEVAGFQPAFRGKVRDIYDLPALGLGEDLVLVATDRISAYDVVLPQGVPDKGSILTSLSEFWFRELGDQVRNHLVSTEVAGLPEPFRTAARLWGPRFMRVKKLDMIPIECVVRGYLVGSGWKEYQRQGTVCGLQLPASLPQAAELAEPIFTPSTKAEDGHDVNISRAEAADLVGTELVDELERLSLQIYTYGRSFARERGVILADTKFEFGNGADGPILADEVLTPDSSRYWPTDEYRTGISPPSYDKQYVRDHLAQQGWTGDGPPPDLPTAVITGTVKRYEEIFERLTGQVWRAP